MKVSDITMGVVFTKRHYNIDNFFRSCLNNDALSRDLNFLIVDNDCDFDIESRVKDWLDGHKYKIIRNKKIESLPYNHNLILLNSNTDYIIHNNDEVYFRENWLNNTLVWILKNGDNKIAHLCRCSKGYYKNFVLKMGFFNEKLSGKDASDSDIEYRELKYLEGKNITIDEFRSIVSKNFEEKIIGGYWKKEWFEPCKSDSWIGSIAVQPDNIKNDKLGDSNTWLKNNKNLSDKNLNIGKSDNWNLVGSQGLDNIYPKFTAKLKGLEK